MGRTKKVADFPSGRGYRYFKTINQNWPDRYILLSSVGFGCDLHKK